MQGPASMSAGFVALPASMANESPGTRLEVPLCWEGDSSFTRELCENTQGLVEQLVLAGDRDPPGEI